MPRSRSFRALHLFERFRFPHRLVLFGILRISTSFRFLVDLLCMAFLLERACLDVGRGPRPEGSRFSDDGKIRDGHTFRLFGAGLEAKSEIHRSAAFWQAASALFLFIYSMGRGPPRGISLLAEAR